MTYTIRSVHRVTCDECNDFTETTFHPDYDNIMSEELWVQSLIDEGWIYHKGYDSHTCPECAKLGKEEQKE